MAQDADGYNMTNKSDMYEEQDLQQPVSDDVADIIVIVFGCFFINIIAPIGVIGNIISIIVLYRHDITQDCSNILLISLAVSDLFNLVTIFIRYCKCLVFHMAGEAAALTADAFVSAYVMMPSRMMLLTSSCLVTLISIQRFVAVFFPMQVRQLFTAYRMKIACVFIYFTIFIIIFVYSLCLTHIWVYSDKLNATIAVMVPTQFLIENFQLITGYSSFFVNIFTGGITLLLIFSSSVAIAVKMIILSKNRQQLTKSNTRAADPKIVKMLLIICFVCFLVFAPTTINDAYVYFIPNIMESSYYRASKAVTEGLFVFHSSCNFVIYVTLSKKFSTALKSMFQCRVDKTAVEKQTTVTSVS